MHRSLPVLLFAIASSASYGQSPVTADDCADAVNICTNSTFAVDPNGSGQTYELTSGTLSNPSTNPASTNAGCLLAGELNSTWMVVNISGSGSLEFTFGAPNGTGCFDWIMFPYNSNTCTEIFNNQIAPVRCNWNGFCEGYTGIAGNPAAINGDPSNFEPPLNVLAGQQYLICLSNYSSLTTTVPLNFFGTAVVSCNTVLSVTSATICQGQSTTLTASGGNNYTWSPATGLNTTTGATVIATPSVTTTYTVTGTSSSGPASGTTTVTVNPSPSLTSSSTQASCSACDGAASVTASGSGPFTYLWAPGAGTTSSINNLCAGTYTVTVTANGCSSTDSVIVTSAVSPSLTVSPAASICPGDSVPLTVSGAASYTWSPATGLSASTGSSVMAFPGSTTTYTVTGTTGTCSSTGSITVNVGPLTANAGPDIAICQGASTQLQVLGGTSYSWSPAAGLSSSTISNPVANPSTTTTYTVSVSSGSCSASDTITVIVNPVPAVTASPATVTVCSGTPSSLSATGAASYAWSPASGLSATTGASVTATPSVTTTYIVTGTSSGCSSTDTVAVTVDPSPNPTIAAAGPFCTDAAAAALSAATPGGTWIGTGITNSSSGTFDPATAGPGTHSIIYSVTTGNCTSADTLQITVNSVPNATITAAGPFCLNTPASNLTAATAGGTWNGTGITNINNGTFNPSIAGTGTHSIIYTVSNNGCIDDDTISVVVNPLPNASITSAGTYCANSPAVNLSAASSGGTWSGTGITSPSSGTFTPSTAGAGTHTITYSVTDANGCTSSSTTSITVNPNANATITPAGPFCLNAAAVNLTAAQTGGVWSGTGITSSSAGTFNPATAGPGSHTITYLISGTCGDTATTTILVAPPPPAPTAPSGSYCSYEIISPLTASVSAGGTLTWYSNSTLTNQVGTGSPFLPVPAPTVTTSYWVTETVNGCQGPATQVTITINPAPTAAFTASQTTGQVPFTVTFTNNSTPNCTYTWISSNPGGLSATTSTAQAEFIEPGSFVITLVATTTAGCSDTAQMTIIADAISAIEMPNVFTPNSDATNDVFKAAYFGITEFHGEIYDRWGLKLFTWNDVSQGWNGITDNGNEAPDGTYYFIVTAKGIDGKDYAFRGFLTLLRKK